MIISEIMLDQVIIFNFLNNGFYCAVVDVTLNNTINDILIDFWAESIKQYNIKTNGFHIFKMYFKNKSRNLITVGEACKEKFEDIRIYKHMGIKYKISEKYHMYTLFTSQNITQINLNMNKEIMYNIQLKNSVFKFANPPIIADDSVFSQYYLIDNNLKNSPDYIINYLNNNIHLKMNKKIEKLVENSYKDFEYALRKADNIYCLIDILYENNTGIKDIKYSNNALIKNKQVIAKLEHLNRLGVRTEEIKDMYNSINSIKKIKIDKNLESLTYM